MKHLYVFLLSLPLLCGMPHASAATLHEGADEDEQLTVYFSAHLKGETLPPVPSRTIKKSRTTEWQRRVWKAWQTANERLQDDLRLPRLDSLSAGRHACWLLPDSLEPHAAMPFYWGCKGTMPQDGYPLFVYLHGSGPKQAEWATGLHLALRFEDAPSAYFIPQIPNEGEYYRWWQRAKQRAKLHAWQTLLRRALLSDSIDADRIYLFGISEGGYGSQRLASFLADYLAAAGPMAGGEPLRNAPPENLANVPFSFLTGANDHMFYRNLFTPLARAALDSLQALHLAHYTHRVELIPGRGHGIDYSPTTPWMRRFRRNPYPRFFKWENLEMDGRKRRGFYNLYLPEAQAPDAPRACYEVRIEGQRVDIAAQTVRYETTSRDSVWGIELTSSKEYEPLAHGRLDVYLCDSLLDTSRRVEIFVNGRRVFHGHPRHELRHLAESCIRYADPRRLYPAAVRVEW